MWYELTNTTKRIDGKTVYQIKYKDGTLGCFIGRNVKLPNVKCETDDKTIIFGDCTLSGKMTIKNSVIGPNVKLFVDRSATITNSTISNSYIYSVRTKIADSIISFVKCRSCGSNNSCPAGVLQITKECNIQGFGDKYYEKFTNIFLHKNSKICMEKVQARAVKRNIDIHATEEAADIHLTNVQMCADKECVYINVGKKVNLNVNDSQIKGTIRTACDCTVTVNSSNITGILQCYSANIKNSKIIGQVFISGGLSMEETNIHKNSLIYCINKNNGTTNIDLMKVTLFGNSKINLHEDYVDSNNFISLSYIVMRDNAVVKIKNKSNFCNCSFRGNSFATGEVLESSRFFDDAIVFAGRCSDCEFSLSARVGCNINGEEIRNSNLISLNGRRIKSRFGSMSINDDNDNVIVTSENENAVYMFSEPTKVQYISDINMGISKYLYSENLKDKLRVGTVQKSIKYTVGEIEKHYAKEEKTYQDVFTGLTSLVKFTVFSILKKYDEDEELSQEEETVLNDLINSQSIDLMKKTLVSGKPIFIKHKYLPDITK